MSSRAQQIDQRLSELHLRRSAIDREIAELFARRCDAKPLPRAVRSPTPPEEDVSGDVLEDVARSLAEKGIG